MTNALLGWPKKQVLLNPETMRYFKIMAIWGFMVGLKPLRFFVIICLYLVG